MLYDVTTERYVLGSGLIAPEFMEFLADADEQIFESQQNRDIFILMRDLHRSGTPVDVMTLLSSIQEAKVQITNVREDQIQMHLVDLTFGVQSTANATELLSQLTRLHSKRQIDRALRQAINNLNSAQDPGEVTAALSDALESAVATSIQDVHMVDSNTIEAFRRDEMMRRLDDTVSLVKSGFETIDALMPVGFFKPGLSIIGAVPKGGKTTFARNLIHNFCDAGHSVVLWSGEMRTEREIDIMASVALGLPYEQFRDKKKLRDPEFIRKVKDFDQHWRDTWKLRIFDDLPMSSGEFFSKVAIMDSKQKIDVLVIDMMDFFADVMLENDPGRRSYVMGNILLRAVSFAKKHNIHVQCLWQWDMPERRRGKVVEPNIMDFRLSRAVIEKADQILLLHRPKLFDSNVVDDFTSVIISVQRGIVRGGTVDLFLSDGLRLVDTKGFVNEPESPF